MITDPVKYKNDLLIKLATNQITMNDLDREVAYWYSDCFSEIHVLQDPTPPPRFAEYEVMTTSEKKDISTAFWQKEDVKAFLDQRDSVRNRNRTELIRLREFKACIPQEDTVTHQKFQEKINDFLSRNFNPQNWQDNERA